MATSSKAVGKAKAKSTPKPRARKSKKPAPSQLKLDPKAPFMGKKHHNYFRQKLLEWKTGISNDLEHTRKDLQSSTINEPDANDRASSECDWSVELRRRDRQRKLIVKIDAALARIESGEYGYCIATGEPISLERLDARPIATMTLEAQEAYERDERRTRGGE